MHFLPIECISPRTKILSKEEFFLCQHFTSMKEGVFVKKITILINFLLFFMKDPGRSKYRFYQNVIHHAFDLSCLFLVLNFTQQAAVCF